MHLMQILNLRSSIYIFISRLIAINNQISTQFEELGITLNYASNIYSEFSNLYRAMKVYIYIYNIIYNIYRIYSAQI